MADQPDFSHGGEFVDWGEQTATIDERFVPLVEVARNNIGQDVELVRWSPDQATAAEFADWWAKQRRAIVAHVGPLNGLRVTPSRRMHKRIGMQICYVRFNRKRPTIVGRKAS